MTRLQMVGRWTQVVGGVLAWILLVPVIELVRASARHLGFVGRKDLSLPREPLVGSSAPVAHHRRRAA